MTAISDTLMGDTKEAWIVGSKSHARVVASAWRDIGGRVLGFIDRLQSTEDEILEEESFLKGNADRSVPLLMGIGCIRPDRLRLEIADRFYQAGFRFASAIHPKAIVDPSVIIEKGTIVLPGAIIGPGAQVKELSIVNQGVILSHDTKIGRGVHMACGAILCGGSKVGDGAFVGAGATVCQGLAIGDDATVGAGSVVVKSVAEKAVVFGNPAY